MMRAHRLLVLAAVVGCAGQAARSGTPSSPRPSPSSPALPAVAPSVDSLLGTLSTRDKAAQLVVPWISGSYAALDDSDFQIATRWIDSLHVGGLIVSFGSPFDIAAKLNTLQ